MAYSKDMKMGICKDCENIYETKNFENGYCKSCRSKISNRDAVNKKEYKEINSTSEMSSGLSWIISNFFTIVFYISCIVGYIANFFAIYHHWNLPITIGHLAEFIGIIIFPLGIFTGVIYLL